MNYAWSLWFCFFKVFFYCLRYRRYEFYVFFCFQILICLSGGCLELCLYVAVAVLISCVFVVFIYQEQLSDFVSESTVVCFSGFDFNKIQLCFQYIIFSSQTECFMLWNLISIQLRLAVTANLISDDFIIW